ncbi:two-component system response regulator [Aquipluma nitroreducens]|uniref:Two-component system response regulator n=1 Tax=Aquipluma nitroreducens TaxID=2010828 RepID=A0A5K7SD74_9BACT|nr:LytTR family DNA-binding domain-containing protein [Aquipluma nitroreducens]BBE19429.1 two-component system response regulator [Aquipluma nitroreducens]
MNSTKISILIIDSEQESMDQALELLQANPVVSDIKTAENTDQAILKIINSNPDIILFDYPSKGKAEKELIEFVKTKLPETTLVLVSKTKEYAAFAIQNGIFKYLLKPIENSELLKIINTVHEDKQNNLQARVNQLIDGTPEETRLRLQTTKGYLMLNPDELIFCKAAGFYTELYLTSDRNELSSQFLSKFEEMLSPFNFIRVSRSHLINQRFIRKIYRSNNIIVLSANGKEYEIKGGRTHIRNLTKLDTE